MTPAELAFVEEFIRENRALLTPKEQRFVALVVFGQQSPTEAARRLGYKSAKTMAARIVRRPHVYNLMLAYRELAAELIRLIDAEEAA